MILFTVTAARRCCLGRGSRYMQVSTSRLPYRSTRWAAMGHGFAGAAFIGLILLLTASYSVTQGYADTEVADPAPEADIAGPLEVDQSSASANYDPNATAAPTPTVASGSVGTYTRSTWDADSVDGPNDLSVVTSSAPGTAALTGIVTDSDTRDPIGGASVSLAPSTGGSGTTTTTAPDGSYAFINIPASVEGTTYTFVVTAAGHGSLTIYNDAFVADATYQQTSSLSTSAQVDDASVANADVAQVTQGSTGGYASNKRVPPTIRVGIAPLNLDCSASGPVSSSRNYPWTFYVLHVAAGEIGGLSFPRLAWKANFAAEQNYAWYFRQHPVAPAEYDIGNSISNQCFRPQRKIPTEWHDWISDPDSAGDPLENHLSDANGNIERTEYRAGTYNCTESAYPQNGNKLSQWGSKARDDNNCGTQTWAAIVKYYYTATLDLGTHPPTPNTSFTRPVGKVHLSFPAQVESGTITSNVGWRYQVDACFPVDQQTCAWGTIYDRGWSAKTRSVPASTDYDPPAVSPRNAAIPTKCLKYRVRAKNPSGWSAFASFNSGQPVCPG